ncbi:hypothetical protein HMPREF0023_0957, partial [Acinetobacter sp. ATCC 27244]
VMICDMYTEYKKPLLLLIPPPLFRQFLRAFDMLDNVPKLLV